MCLVKKKHLKLKKPIKHKFESRSRITEIMVSELIARKKEIKKVPFRYEGFKINGLNFCKSNLINIFFENSSMSIFNNYGFILDTMDYTMFGCYF